MGEKEILQRATAQAALYEERLANQKKIIDRLMLERDVLQAERDQAIHEASELRMQLGRLEGGY